jgi:hypothetical protein
MARKKFTVGVHIPIDGVDYLWFEIDEERNVTYYLPEDETEAIEAVKQKMLDNVGKNMSRFYFQHPELLKGE